MTAVRCHGCGAMVPAGDGATHAYIGAAAGCWALYGEVLAREYEDFRFARHHQLTVDSYATQHPGRPERRAIQSVAVHLIGLHLNLERGLPGYEIPRLLQRAADRSDAYHWLEPPESSGSVTVVDVHAAGDDADAHLAAVRRWAESTWAAWAPHHAQVRAWARETSSGARSSHR